MRHRLSVLFVLFFISCSKSDTNNSDIVINQYMTTTCIDYLQMFSSVESSSEIIMKIPFKSKVEIIDKRIITRNISEHIYKYIKIRYKNQIGYVYLDYLSDKDDIPFIDNVKYNYEQREFDFNEDAVYRFAIDTLRYNKDCKHIPVSYYYTENPQMFSYYTKDCDNRNIKKVLVMINSKVNKYLNRQIIIIIDNNKLKFSGCGMGDRDNIEKLIEELKDPGCCYNC